MDKCIWCGQPKESLFHLRNLLRAESSLICRDCFRNFERDSQKGATCPGCGRRGNVHLCQDCLAWKAKEEQFFLINQASFPYQALEREWMKRYKFEGDCRMVKVIEPFLKADLSKYSKWKIVPIPSSSKSLQERGFATIVYALSQWNISYYEVLLDSRIGKKQSEKNKVERMQLSQPFKWLDGTCPFKTNDKILLVDDVYTTGTTLHRAGKLFFEAGLRNVQSLTWFR